MDGWDNTYYATARGERGELLCGIRGRRKIRKSVIKMMILHLHDHLMLKIFACGGLQAAALLARNLTHRTSA